MKIFKKIILKYKLMKRNKRPYMIGVGGRIALTLIVIFSLASIICGCYLFVTRMLRYVEEENTRHSNICKVVADLVDDEVIMHYYKTNEIDDKYYEIEQKISRAILAHESRVRLYIFVPEEDDLVIIYGINTPDDSERQLGKRIPYDESDDVIMPEVRAGRSSEQVTITEHNDNMHYLCSWAPIIDADGNVVAFAELEIDTVSFGEEYAMTLGHPFRNAFITFAFLLIFIMLLIHKIVTGPINELTKYVESYERGRFKESMYKFTSNNEITYLAKSFTLMNQRIEEYISEVNAAAKEAERTATEMGIASGIQQSMLNTEFPAFPDRKEFDLHAFMTPTAYVGGDFYDFFFTDENHLALVIADVSGGSVSGAMFMMRAMTNIKNFAMVFSDPATILTKVNDELCTHNSEGMFVTVWIGILDINTGKMICANGGHEYPFIQRSGEKFEILQDNHDLVLGGMEGIKYNDYEINLNPGDRIYVYTDGVPECMDKKENQFGMAATIDVLNNCLEQAENEALVSAKMLDDKVYEALKQHMGTVAQYDDITMLCLKYMGNVEEK